MTKSKRKAAQRIIKDRYTGNPLTEKEWIDAVKEAEESDYRKTAFRNGLGRFLKSKGFLVFALLVFPPLALLNGCASNTPIVDREKIRTAPLLQNVAHGNKTFIKGNRYRIVQLETGEMGAILDAEIASALLVPMEAIYGVEIGEDGCTTGRRFYLHGDNGSVSSSMVDKDLKLWTPSSFCFDMSRLD